MSGNLLEKIANLTKTIHLMLLDALRPQSFVALLVFQRESTFFSWIRQRQRGKKCC